MRTAGGVHSQRCGKSRQHSAGHALPHAQAHEALGTTTAHPTRVCDSPITCNEPGVPRVRRLATVAQGAPGATGALAKIAINYLISRLAKNVHGPHASPDSSCQAVTPSPRPPPTRRHTKRAHATTPRSNCGAVARATPSAPVTAPHTSPRPTHPRSNHGHAPRHPHPHPARGCRPGHSPVAPGLVAQPPYACRQPPTPDAALPAPPRPRTPTPARLPRGRPGLPPYRCWRRRRL